MFICNLQSINIYCDSPADDPTNVIIAAARRLDRNNVPLKKFGIQFTQIGDDPEATEALQELDDDLAGAHGIRVCVFCSFISFIHGQPAH